MFPAEDDSFSKNSVICGQPPPTFDLIRKIGPGAVRPQGADFTGMGSKPHAGSLMAALPKRGSCAAKRASEKSRFTLLPDRDYAAGGMQLVLLRNSSLGVLHRPIEPAPYKRTLIGWRFMSV